MVDESKGEPVDKSVGKMRVGTLLAGPPAETEMTLLTIFEGLAETKTGLKATIFLPPAPVTTMICRPLKSMQIALVNQSTIKENVQLFDKYQAYLAWN